MVYDPVLKKCVMTCPTGQTYSDESKQCTSDCSNEKGTDWKYDTNNKQCMKYCEGTGFCTDNSNICYINSAGSNVCVAPQCSSSTGEKYHCPNGTLCGDPSLKSCKSAPSCSGSQTRCNTDQVCCSKGGCNSLGNCCGSGTVPSPGAVASNGVAAGCCPVGSTDVCAGVCYKKSVGGKVCFTNSTGAQEGLCLAANAIYDKKSGKAIGCCKHPPENKYGACQRVCTYPETTTGTTKKSCGDDTIANNQFCNNIAPNGSTKGTSTCRTSACVYNESTSGPGLRTNVNNNPIYVCANKAGTNYWGPPSRPGDKDLQEYYFNEKWTISKTPGCTKGSTTADIANSCGLKAGQTLGTSSTTKLTNPKSSTGSCSANTNCSELNTGTTSWNSGQGISNSEISMTWDPKTNYYSNTNGIVQGVPGEQAFLNNGKYCKYGTCDGSTCLPKGVYSCCPNLNKNGYAQGIICIQPTTSGSSPTYKCAAGSKCCGVGGKMNPSTGTCSCMSGYTNDTVTAKSPYDKSNTSKCRLNTYNIRTPVPAGTPSGTPLTSLYAPFLSKGSTKVALDFVGVPEFDGTNTTKQKGIKYDNINIGPADEYIVVLRQQGTSGKSAKYLNIKHDPAIGLCSNADIDYCISLGMTDADAPMHLKYVVRNRGLRTPVDSLDNNWKKAKDFYPPGGSYPTPGYIGDFGNASDNGTSKNVYNIKGEYINPSKNTPGGNPSKGSGYNMMAYGARYLINGYLSVKVRPNYSKGGATYKLVSGTDLNASTTQAGLNNKTTSPASQTSWSAIRYSGEPNYSYFTTNGNNTPGNLPTGITIITTNKETNECVLAMVNIVALKQWVGTTFSDIYEKTDGFVNTGIKFGKLNTSSTAPDYITFEAPTKSQMAMYSSKSTEFGDLPIPDGTQIFIMDLMVKALVDGDTSSATTTVPSVGADLNGTQDANFITSVTGASKQKNVMTSIRNSMQMDATDKDTGGGNTRTIGDLLGYFLSLFMKDLI